MIHLSFPVPAWAIQAIAYYAAATAGVCTGYLLVAERVTVGRTLKLALVWPVLSVFGLVALADKCTGSHLHRSAEKRRAKRRLEQREKTLVRLLGRNNEQKTRV